MDSHRLDLGLVSELVVESFGEPGQRTFRILAEVADGNVSVWLEKEQIVMLGAAVDELLERLPSPQGAEPKAQGTSFMGELEVKAGGLSIGFDMEAEAFRLEATDFLASLPVTTIAFYAARYQLERASKEIERIVAGSRPRCVLCGTPLTGEPHFCPESNGHVEFEMER